MKIEKNNFVTALLWVLFIPAGIWAGRKAMHAVSFLNEQIWNRFSNHTQTSFIEQLYLSGSTCFVFGAVAILTSAFIVPRYKGRVVFILAVTYLVLSAGCVVIILATTQDFLRIWMYVLENIGALAGVLFVEKGENKKQGANE